MLKNLVLREIIVGGSYPLAMKRLGRQIFVPELARRLIPGEYEIVYEDKRYIKNARDFAIVLDGRSATFSDTVLTYADRQKDRTNIGLSDNLGSGRAVYYGDRFNILGVGRTSLCKSVVPSHSNGELEMIGAIRRIVLSNWINFFTQRAPEHPLLIALKKTTYRQWAKNHIPLSLLVRIDGGCLDRPSHVEYSPEIDFDFNKTLTEYAKIDAEYFAFRFMLGAWSTSNYSLKGDIIDLESASFVKYRAPYFTSSSKYPHTLFGHEGLGFIRILRQLADAKGLSKKSIQCRFYEKRRAHLGRCFLLLLGIEAGRASDFFSRNHDLVTDLSERFEQLAKMTSHQGVDLNLYKPILKNKDPSLLDMTKLFKNLACIYKTQMMESKAIKLLAKKNTLPKGTRKFVRDLFCLLNLLDLDGCLTPRVEWDRRLRVMNQDLLSMFELNKRIASMVELYRLGRLSREILGRKISRLCEMPRLRSGS